MWGGKNNSINERGTILEATTKAVQQLREAFKKKKKVGTIRKPARKYFQ